MLGLINEWRRNSAARQDFRTILWYIGHMIWADSNATPLFPPGNGFGVLGRVTLCLRHRTDAWRTVHAFGGY